MEMRKMFAMVFALAFAGVAVAQDSTGGFVNPYADYRASSSVSNLVKTLTWCSLGTSVTDFNDDPIAGRTQGYQYFVMDKLGWSHDKLLNIGHSGSTIGIANDFPMTTPYDIYTVEFGINDWGTGHIVGTIADYENYRFGNAVRWHNFAACYRYVIETIRAANPNAIIVLTTPRKGYGFDGKFPALCDDLTVESSMTVKYWDPETNDYLHERTRLADYAALIRQIARRENLVLCDWFESAANQDNLADLSVDVALHPNDAGYEIMAQMLAPKILQAIARAYPEDPDADDSVVALRNLSGAVAVGTAYELPATVKGLSAAGDVLCDVPVTWPSAQVTFDAPGVFKVEGHATQDTAQKVSASIRVVIPPVGENVTPQAASITSTDANNPSFAALKKLGDAAPADTQLDWVTSNRQKGDLAVTLSWDSPVTLARLRICYSGKHTPPTSYDFTGDGVTISATTSEIETIGDHRWIEFEFDEAQTLTTLGCTFGGDTRWLVVERIWAYTSGGGSSGGGVTPNTGAQLESVTVDGVALPGFNPSVLQYVIRSGAIDAESSENAAVTILPNRDERVCVVTLSEDGATSLTYRFDMPVVRYLRNIGIPAARGQAPSLPTTVKGLSARGIVAVDVPVVWDEVPPPETAALYTVTGHAVDNPSLGVTASVRVVEATGEATDPVNAALKSKGGSVTLVIKDTDDEARTKEQWYIVDELIPEKPDWGDRATSRPNSGTVHCDTEVTLTFASTEEIGKVCAYYELSGDTYGVPTGVTFYDEGGNVLAYGEPTVSDFSDAVKKYEYRFVRPKALGKLKIVFENNASSPAKYISLIETEAWTTGAAVADLTPLAGDSPSLIKVDGRPIDGFDPEVLEYQVPSGAITVDFGTGENANMGVTVLPRWNKIARVITVAEDGLSTCTYELTVRSGLWLYVR